MTRLNILSILFSISITAVKINSREFHEDDIISYPIIINPPYPGAFKCFTCKNSFDNYDCNVNSIDLWCPEDTHYCKTIHVFKTDWKEIQHDRKHYSSDLNSKVPYSNAKFKETLQVNKFCATRDECHGLNDKTVCKINPNTGNKECSKCCDGHICNMEVPKSSRSLKIDRNAVFLQVESTTMDPYILEQYEKFQEQKLLEEKLNSLKQLEASSAKKEIDIVERIVTRNTNHDSADSENSGNSEIISSEEDDADGEIISPKIVYLSQASTAGNNSSSLRLKFSFNLLILVIFQVFLLL